MGAYCICYEQRVNILKCVGQLGIVLCLSWFLEEQKRIHDGAWEFFFDFKGIEITSLAKNI